MVPNIQPQRQRGPYKWLNRKHDEPLEGLVACGIRCDGWMKEDDSELRQKCWRCLSLHLTENKTWRHLHSSGFLSLDITDILVLYHFFYCWGGFTVHYGVFSGTPSLFPLDASGTPPITHLPYCGNHRCIQTLPNCPQSRTTAWPARLWYTVHILGCRGGLPV